jgi:hypothetical protein
MKVDNSIQVLDTLNRIKQDSIHFIVTSPSNQESLADQVALWGQAIGGLFTAVTFIYLIVKDAKRRKEISQLETITQNSISQVNLLKEMNNLTTRQMNILTEIAVSGTNDREHAEELVKIERTRLKIENRPNLRLMPSSSDPNHVYLKIENTGKAAHIVRFQLLEGNVHLQIAENQTIEPGGVINATGSTVGGANMNHERIMFQLEYTDQIGTAYRSIFRVRDKPREETVEI